MSHDQRHFHWLANKITEVSQAESQIPLNYGQNAVEIPGSRDILDQLETAGAPWAIVTSGTRPLVTGWLKVMKLAQPEHMVTAEDVKNGKPDPACYRLGAERLGLANEEPSRILVLEDSPSGVQAGKAAGYRVVALATTHAVERLREAGADWIVKDMCSVVMTRFDGKNQSVGIEVRNALAP